MYQAQPSQRQVTNQEVERSVVRTHLFLCCGPRVGPDTIKTKEKSFRIDNRNSAGADGGPRSRVYNVAIRIAGTTLTKGPLMGVIDQGAKVIYLIFQKL